VDKLHPAGVSALRDINIVGEALDINENIANYDDCHIMPAFQSCGASPL